MKSGAFVRSLFGSVMSTRINVRILMNVHMKLLLPSLLSFVLISSHGQIKCSTKDFKITEASRSGDAVKNEVMVR